MVIKSELNRLWKILSSTVTPHYFLRNWTFQGANRYSFAVYTSGDLYVGTLDFDLDSNLLTKAWDKKDTALLNSIKKAVAKK